MSASTPGVGSEPLADDRPAQSWRQEPAVKHWSKKSGHRSIHHWSNSEVVKLRQGSVRVLEDGRVWLSLREAGGHSVSWLWSRDADRRLVLNK